MPQFRRTVWRYYRAHGRHDLPWRPTSPEATKGKKDDILYRVLVSEVMLQQTQVDRVIPFYKNFIKTFPTAKRLAAAPLSEVLKCWQGLGYNRRAKMLHAAAKELAMRKITTVSELETLPGVGPYTARAVAAFAFNQDVVVIETNIRTAVIHHFFSDNRNTTIYRSVSDAQIQEVLEKVLPKGRVLLRPSFVRDYGRAQQGYEGRAREWYSALMDYGAHLKRSGISHNARSKTYAKQSRFAGSVREARGAVLRELTNKQVSHMRLVNLLGAERKTQTVEALGALLSEGLIKKSGRNYVLAD